MNDFDKLIYESLHEYAGGDTYLWLLNVRNLGNFSCLLIILGTFAIVMFKNRQYIRLSFILAILVIVSFLIELFGIVTGIGVQALRDEENLSILRRVYMGEIIIVFVCCALSMPSNSRLTLVIYNSIVCVLIGLGRIMANESTATYMIITLTICTPFLVSFFWLDKFFITNAVKNMRASDTRQIKLPILPDNNIKYRQSEFD